MSTRLFIVNAEPPEIRIAELLQNEVIGFAIERGERLLGDIYKGRVENVVPGMDAAFVDVGLARNALLHVSDLGNNEAMSDKVSFQSIQSLIRPGEELLVQVARPPLGSKGARVTTRIALPGRYVVLVASVESIGVSRRIESDEERARLRRIAEKLRPLDHGLIVRTEAENISESDLQQDVSFLWKQLQSLQQRASATPAPALLHHDLGLLGRVARDRLSENVEAIIIDLPDVYQEFRDLVQAVAPRLAERVVLYAGDEPIFDHYRISAATESAMKRVVPLQHGAHLVIEETEALTAIDVNTGKYVGKNRLADTILHTNLEAVEEAARQLRLRDIGGIIVIDLIDMERTRDRVKVMNALEAALKYDHTRTRIVQLSPTGLVEITRRREGQSLRQLMHQPCPYCSGEGMVKTAATVAIETRRRVRAVAHKSRGGAMQVTLHPETASAFLGLEAGLIQALEESANVQVFVRVDPELHLEATHTETGQVEDFVVADFTPGQRLHLPPDSPLYPDATPQFTVLHNLLIFLQNCEGIESRGGAPQAPAVIEVVEVGRWFITARAIAFGQAGEGA